MLSSNGWQKTKKPWASRPPKNCFNELPGALAPPIKLSPEQLRRLPKGTQTRARPAEPDRNDSHPPPNQSPDRHHRAPIWKKKSGLRAAQLQERTWDEIGDESYHAVDHVFQQRIERLLGEQGQVSRDLDAILSRIPAGELSDRMIIDLLRGLSVGSRLAFDARTHRKTQRQYQRLRYHFLAASLIQESTPAEITERILEHLEDALEALQRARGLSEIQRLANIEQVTLQQIDPRIQEEVRQELGEEKFKMAAEKPFGSLGEDERQLVSLIFGRRIQNEINRQLLFAGDIPISG